MSNHETMDRITWLKHLLEAIAQFASEEFQQSAWVGFNGPDGSSFEEASELLEDLRLEEAISLPSNPYRLEPTERKVLSEFWRALDDYSKHVYETRVRKVGENYASPTLVISQPEWRAVREAALAVLKHFKAAGFGSMPKLPIFDRGTLKVDERSGRTVFYYYRRIVLYVVETFAFLFCVVTALFFILIVSDLLFKFNWGYPWWSLFVDLVFMALSIMIFFAAKAGLRSP
jgi:hypothetical protein